MAYLLVEHVSVLFSGTRAYCLTWYWMECMESGAFGHIGANMQGKKLEACTYKVPRKLLNLLLLTMPWLTTL